LSASPVPRAGVRRRTIILLAAIGGILALLAAGAPVALAEPAYDVEPPEVELAPGNRLVCAAGSWEGAGIKFSYTWLRDGSAFATGPAYTLTNADKGHTFTCIVLGKNNEGSEEEESWNSYTYGTGSSKRPENTSPPEVSGGAKAGEAKVGEALECQRGSWTGVPAPTYTFEWLRDGLPIEAATANTYTVQKADEGYSLACKVTATNSVGSAAKQSSNSLKVAGTPPSNDVLPRVLGTGAVGQQLTCAPEKWKGAPPPTFTYKWWRDHEEIAGAAGASYTIQTADQVHKLSCEVTAENASGKAKAKSSNEVEVVGSPPSNTEPPMATGTGKLGGKLICEPGKWAGEPAPTLKYQWLRNNQPISLATTSTYTVGAEDEGKFDSCQVTATNGVGNPAVAVSNAIEIEGESSGPSLPVNTERPVISVTFGEPSVGHTLMCSTGSWHAEPAVTSYGYQWMREGTVVGSSSTYTVVEADRGLKLVCRVKAKNTVGTGNADSEPIQIRGLKPAVGPPILFGAHVVGETLTCAPDSVEGVPKPTFSYRWLRDGAPVAEGNSYVIKKSDKGHSLVCEITATNLEGSASATSAPVEVPALPPKLVLAPTISGSSPGPGTTLTCNSQWSGEPEPTLSYVWLTDGGPIEGAISSTYVLTKFDEGHLLACEVIATNPAGQERAVSARVRVPGSPPEVVEEPRVAGVPQVGEELRCEPGLWRGKPSPSLTFQWLLNGSEIAGATEETYVPGAEDLGSYISCLVTGTSTEGTYEAWSENTPQIVPHAVRKLEVAPAPPFTKPPTKAPTAAQIRVALEKQLMAALKKARRSGLLKKGSFSFSFLPPTGGKLEFLWYQTSKGSKTSSKPKPVLLARVRSTFGTVSARTQQLRLTLAGRRVLKGSKHPKLTVEGVFIPAGGTAVSWSKRVTLSG